MQHMLRMKINILLSISGGDDRKLAMHEFVLRFQLIKRQSKLVIEAFGFTFQILVSVVVCERHKYPKFFDFFFRFLSRLGKPKVTRIKIAFTGMETKDFIAAITATLIESFQTSRKSAQSKYLCSQVRSEMWQ